MHSFSLSSHFICQAEYRTSIRFRCGYSKRTNMFTENHEGYYVESLWPNFVDNSGTITKYPYLENVPGDHSTMIRLTTGEIRVGGVCDSGKFIYLGDYKYCVSACPAGMTHQVKYIDGNIHCTTECDSGDSTMLDDPTICIRPDCASVDGLKHYGPVGDKKCVATCQQNYKYEYNTSFCQDSCPDFMEPTSNTFHASDETGTCIASCATSKYQLRDTTLTYPATGNPVKKYCFSACDQGSYTRYWDNGTTKHCTNTCLSESANTGIPSTYRYYTNNGGSPDLCSEECTGATNFIHSVANFGISTESGECILNCPTTKYQLRDSTVKFSTNTVKQYCLDACDKGSYTRYWNNGTTKHCTNTCDSTSANTGIPQEYGYYTNISGGVDTCTKECTGATNYIHSVVNFGAATESGECITGCTITKYQLTATSLKFTTNTIKKYCLDTCDKGSYTKYWDDTTKKHCTNTCDSTASDTGIPQEYGYYTNVSGGVDTCTKECTGATNFIHSVVNFGIATESGECILNCPTTKYQLRDTSVKFTTNTVKQYCVDACDKGSYTRYWDNGTTKHCTNTCDSTSANTGIPQEYGYYTNVSGGVDTCTKECTGATNYIHSVVNFGTATESGECITGCSTTKYQLTATSLKFTTNTVKKYCVDACDQGIYTRYWNNGTTKHCTNTCESTSANTGIPQEYGYYTNVSGGVDTCTKECTGATNFIHSVANFGTATESGECITGCTATKYQLRDTSVKFTTNTVKQYCLDTCDKGSYTRYWDNGTTKHCTNTCLSESANTGIPATYRYYTNNGGSPDLCSEECTGATNFIHSVVNFGTATESGECILNCPTTKYQLKDSTVKFSTNTVKQYCLDACDKGIYARYWDNETTKHCTNTCLSESANTGVPSTYRYYTNNGASPDLCSEECSGATNFIHSVVNFGIATESGECILNCPTTKYQLRDSTVKFTTNTVKQYCLNTCDKGIYTRYWDNGTTKHCTDTCLSESANTGVPATYRYYTNNGVGTSTCAQKCITPKEFISSINNFNTSTEYGECVATCGTADGYQLSEAVLLYGDSSQKKYCDTDCNRTHSSTTFNRVYHNTTGSFYQCTNSCDPQVTTTAKPVAKNYENVSGGKTWCEATCTNFHDITDIATLNTANNTGVCVTDCGTDFYLNEPWGSSTWYCVDTACPSIQEFYFINSSNSRKTCINSCPSNLPFLDPIKKECIVSCQPTYPYQDDSKNCLMNCHAPFLFIDGTDCASQCPLNKPYYSLQGQENICSTQCSAGSLIHVNISGAFSIEDLVQAEPRSECSLSCSKLKFESNLTFPETTMTKNYCLDSCPNGFYSVDNPADKRCISYCDSQSPYKYATPDFRCVIDCISSGYKYFNEDLTCSNTCSKLIDNKTACVSTCPTERKYSFESHCTNQCPDSEPFLEDYTTCSKECKDKFYGKICVSDCNEEKLKAHYAENKLVFAERKFILSTGECSSSCSEALFPFIDENTFKCISSCPQPCEGSICPSPKMRLRDEKMFCREACTDPDFPYKDEEGLECLSKCRPERPFFQGPNKDCVSKCSPEYPLVLKRNNCTSGECDQNCSDFKLECVPKCTKTKPFSMKREGFAECVCNCPEFFFPNPDLDCELRCDTSLGLVESDSGQSCEHCFKDKGKQFMFEGNCVQKCPEGYAFNSHYVCKKCIEMDLWTNDKLRCVPKQFCDPLSRFDFVNKTCTKCTGEGYMLKYTYPNTIECTKTDCSEGNIEQDGSFLSCYVCQNENKNLFYLDKNCLSTCPNNLTYELFKSTCTESCASHCTTSCCKNGKCAGSVCQCNEGFFGTRCDYQIKHIDTIFSEMIKFILSRFSPTGVDINALEVMIDIQNSVEISNKRLLQNRQDDTKRFLNNALAYLEDVRIKNAYQPMILTLLDGLLGISTKYYNLYSDKQFFDLTLSIIDTISVEIQEFNTTLSVVPEFEIVSEAYFRGTNFSLDFGTDVAKNSKIEFSTCAGKIRQSLGLDFTVPLPYFYLTFSDAVSSKIQRKAEKSLLVSENPVKEVAIFITKNGQTNVNAVCAENYVDLSFEIELENDSSKESAQKFKTASVNVFNQNDPFFVDKCRPFTDENGNDLTLNKRKEAFFLDPKELCKETKFQVCEVEQKDTGFECKCKGIKDKKKSSLESVAASYPDTNYILFTCWDVFRELSLLENYGFYTIFVPFILSAIFSFYIMNRMNKKLNSNSRFEYIRTDLGFFDPETMDKQAYFTECEKIKELATDPSFVILVKDITPETVAAGVAAVPTIQDLEHLDLGDLIRYDHRSAFKHAMDTLRSQHGFFSTFLIESPLNPQVYVVLLYCTELNLAVMLNAFFIEDSLVDNKNESDGGGLFHSFRNELPKTIWAIVTTKVIMLVVTFFYKIDYKKAKKMESRLTAAEGGIAMRGFDNYMNSQRFRLILFILVIVAVNSILGYFVSIYVYVYANSKDIWINGVIMGLIVDNLIIEMFGPLILICSREVARAFPSARWVNAIGMILSRLKNFQME